MAAGLLVALGAAWCASSGAAEDPLTDDDVVVRTEGAHRLLLPKDWPVEQRDSLLVPASIEEYLGLKLEQIRAKFGALDDREDELAQRLERLEAAQRAIEQRLQRLEAEPPASP